MTSNHRRNLIFQYQKKRSSLHTKNVDTQLCIDWREESINKMNEPPGEVECYRYGEENHTGIFSDKNIKTASVLT